MAPFALSAYANDDERQREAVGDGSEYGDGPADGVHPPEVCLFALINIRRQVIRHRESPEKKRKENASSVEHRCHHCCPTKQVVGGMLFAQQHSQRTFSSWRREYFLFFPTLHDEQTKWWVN